MEKVIYRGKTYKLRTFMVKWPPENPTGKMWLKIGSASLGETMDFEKDGWDLDQKIYYYIDDKDFNKSAKYICKNCLDEEFELIKEED